MTFPPGVPPVPENRFHAWRMTDFLAESEELLRKIVRADGACLIFKSKSSFSVKWRHTADFLEIGGASPRSSSRLCRDCFSRLSRREFGIKKRLFSNRGFQFPGSEKNRKIVRPLHHSDRECPVKSNPLHGACHFRANSLKPGDLQLFLPPFSRFSGETKNLPKSRRFYASPQVFSLPFRT